MNYTENYHLPQWEKTDRIMMDDFNAAMAGIETGLTANKTTADTGIAEAKAEAAKLPYAVGSYTGNGAEIREISLGFQPRFLIICSDNQTDVFGQLGQGTTVVGETVNHSRLYLTSSGFRIDTTGTTYRYPELNVKRIAYDYIAFK